MNALSKQRVCIFVDRASRQWVVRDPDGHLWILPPSEHAWDDRQPYVLTEDCDLEMVPGHYRYLLKLPF